MEEEAKRLFPNWDKMEGYIPEDLDIYEDTGYYIEPFVSFRYDLNSLYRYWELLKKQIKAHEKNAVEQRESIKGPYRGEREMAFDEAEGVDIEKFPEFLMSSVITFEISILETCLLELSRKIAKDRGIPLYIEDRSNWSFLDKYLYWLRAKAGLEIDYDPEVYRNIDAVRIVRNSFIHKLGNDIPEKAKKIIREMLQGQTDENIKVNEEFVEASFENIAEFVKQAEYAYIEDWEERNESTD